MTDLLTATARRRVPCVLNKLTLLLGAILFSAALSVTAEAATYYSQGSLPPNLPPSWNSSPVGLGTPPLNFTSGDTFVIQNTHNMTTLLAWAISGAGSKLQIQSGGTLTANNAVTLAAATTFQLDAGGTYVHNNTSAYGSTIFQGAESFAAASTVILNNSNTAGPSGVAFGNLAINFTSTPGGNVNCGGGLTSIGGNLTVTSTSTVQFILTGATALTLNIAGNYSQTGGTFVFGNGNANPVVNLSGNFSLSGGTFNLSNSNNNDGTLNASGDFSHTGGTITVGGNANTDGSIFFNKAGVQTFTSGGTVTGNVDFTVNSGSTLNLGTNNVTGRTFTLSSGATLGIGSPAGITSAGATGNVQTTTRNFSTGANYTYNGVAAQSTGNGLPATVNNLTIANSAGVTLTAASTVNGVLALNSGDLTTNALTLTQAGTSAGTTDVVGNVRRTTLDATPRAFGNPHNQISFQTGTAPTEITVNLVKSVPVGAQGFPTAVQRTYTITPTGGSGYLATLRLHYLDTELNGNAEADLNLWRFDGTRWLRYLKSASDTSNNWVENNAVNQMSPWTMSSIPLAPTAVKMRETSATLYDGGTVIEWRTGSEVDNLGFRIYREDAGRRTLITPSLVAGSALTTGPRTVLAAGNSYTWIDRAGTPASRYWLEDVDTDGRSRMHGPFWPVGPASARTPHSHQSLLLSELGAPAGARGTQRQWAPSAGASQQAEGGTPEGVPTLSVSRQGVSAPGAVGTPQGISAPRTIAAVKVVPPTNLGSREAVKLSVRKAGWYRVTRAQLEAVGLSASADPARLQLFVDGYELAVRLDARAWAQDGVVEFYGEGADRPATDARVYWLVEGTAQGRRIAPPGGTINTTPPRLTRAVASAAPVVISGGGATSPTGFDYTVERRDRNIYFSALLNGERENFFGGVVSSASAPQVVTARDIDARTPAQARLDVALQGVTAGPHVVRVTLNGAELGTLRFAGRENKSASFAVSPTLLRAGDNEVGLISSAPSDVSLTDYIRLTYRRAYRAEGDRLSFTAPGGVPVQITSFTRVGARVVDITDPANPTELAVTHGVLVGGGYAVTVRPGGAGQRRLLAFTPASTEQASGVAANRPSSLRDPQNSADFVVITHADFRAAADTLTARRSSEGLASVVVDVEDIYDEFSFGAYSPAAVRDFLARARASWLRAPRYVLLLGDGSYDPRGHLGRGAFDFVPARLIDTDYMETASDDWFADFDRDDLPEMAVGRLPVRTPAEAERVVSKIVGHTPGGARRAALTVADRTGADGYNFESALTGVESLLPGGFAVERVNRGARAASEVRAEITSRINEGPALVNYMGHGSLGVWTGEGILRGEDAATLSNGARLPLFVLMTCLNGYYHDPSLDSLSESLLKAEHGGALAVWASTGMTEPEAQAAMNRELLRHLFGPESLTLGEAARRAKRSAADPHVRRTWVFIGDPTSRW